MLKDTETEITCKECGIGLLSVDWGEPEDFYSPGYAPLIYCVECGWEDDVWEYPSNAKHPCLQGYVLTLGDIAQEILGEPVKNPQAFIEKSLFKFTDSGVAFGHDEYGVSIVPYAEGFDGELEPIRLAYPFKMDKFWDAVTKADKVGCHVWTCINEHDQDCECYLDPYFFDGE